MAQRTCSVDGCETVVRARGLCSGHYSRAVKNGEVVTTPPTTSAETLAALSLLGPIPCWEWQGRRNRTGYGVVWHRVEGRRMAAYAHRWSYERLVGPIPEGLVLDHLCRVRNCVNPSHLEPVTLAENTRRGDIYRATNEDGDPVCKNGHVVVGDNALVRAAMPHLTQCRQCNRASSTSAVRYG